MERWLAAVGGVYGLLAVALGAFGAHALQGRLTPADLATFEIGVRYQMYHALALLFLAVWVARAAEPSSLALWAGVAFAAGVLVFSGSLYTLVLTGVRGLGAVTPIGGVLLLVGWGLLIGEVLRRS